MSRKAKASSLLAVASVFGLVLVASASAAPNWTVKGAALGSGVSEEMAEETTVEKFGSETTANLKLVVPEFLTISCTALKIVSGKITGPEKDSASSRVFSGCKIFGPKEESTVCTVTSEKGANGTVKTTALTSQLKRNAKSETFDYVSPVGEVFATVEIGSCALSGSYKITGLTAAKPEYNTNATTLMTQLSQPVQQDATAVVRLGVRVGYPQGTYRHRLKSGNTYGVTP